MGSSKKQRKKSRSLADLNSISKVEVPKIKDPLKKSIPELVEEFREMFSKCENEEEFFTALATSLFRTVNCSPRKSEFGPYWTPFEKIKEFLTQMKSLKWRWPRNPSCKYVNFWMDTRDGACIISNRAEHMISFEELMYQYVYKSEEKKEKENETGTL